MLGLWSFKIWILIPTLSSKFDWQLAVFGKLKVRVMTVPQSGGEQQVSGGSVTMWCDTHQMWCDWWISVMCILCDAWYTDNSILCPHTGGCCITWTLNMRHYLSVHRSDTCRPCITHTETRRAFLGFFFWEKNVFWTSGEFVGEIFFLIVKVFCWFNCEVCDCVAALCIRVSLLQRESIRGHSVEGGGWGHSLLATGKPRPGSDWLRMFGHWRPARLGLVAQLSLRVFLCLLGLSSALTVAMAYVRCQPRDNDK